MSTLLVDIGWRLVAVVKTDAPRSEYAVSQTTTSQVSEPQQLNRDGGTSQEF